MAPIPWDTVFVVAVFLVGAGVLLVATVGRPGAAPVEDAPVPAGSSARDSLAALDAAIGHHIARSNALFEAAHWVLIDTQDGGAPTREHLRALWEAYMAFRGPEADAVEGGGIREDAAGVD